MDPILCRGRIVTTGAPSASAQWLSLARFASVGVLGTFIYFGVLWTLVERLRFSAMLATCCAFLVVVGVNYMSHRYWTFRSRAPHGEAAPRFLIVSMIGFCVNGAVMSVGLQHSGLNYLAVQAVAIIIVVLCNFFGARWIFRRDDRAKHVPSPKG